MLTEPNAMSSGQSIARLEGGMRMTAIEYLDHPASGWFALDVMRKKARKWDWVALMVDVDPDDLKICTCDFPALLYVHPKDYRPGARTASQRWFRIPGKHGNLDDAWAALEDVMATRH
jgi:hypothetical protein